MYLDECTRKQVLNVGAGNLYVKNHTEKWVV